MAIFQVGHPQAAILGVQFGDVVVQVYFNVLFGELGGGAHDECVMVVYQTRNIVGQSTGAVGDKACLLVDDDLQVRVQAPRFGGRTHACGTSADNNQPFSHSIYLRRFLI